MLFKFGRLLQLVGLLIAPFGMAGNIARPDQYGDGWVLGVACVGVAVFTLGWLLQQATRPK